MQITKMQDSLWLGANSKNITDKMGFYSLKAKENMEEIHEFSGQLLWFDLAVRKGNGMC